MVGYGPEDNHFVVELTYNYHVKNYDLGDDYRYITIASNQILENARKHDYPVSTTRNEVTGVNEVFVNSPDGYRFLLLQQEADQARDPVRSVTLQASNLHKSLEYWNGVLGMSIIEQKESSAGKEAVLSFGTEYASLQLVQFSSKAGRPVDHATAFGRIAFSVPSVHLQQIQAKSEAGKHTVLTPYVSLDTPGKATVQVVILADPDGHEICFVGDEGFRELSKVDPAADKLLEEAIQSDKSVEWFAKKAARLATADSN